MKNFAQIVANISGKGVKALASSAFESAFISLGCFNLPTDSHAKNLALHPIKKAVCAINQHRYEVNTEEGVALLLGHFLKAHETFADLDIGYLSSESNCAEEDFEMLSEFDECNLILGAELASHKNAKNLALILGHIAKKEGVSVFCEGLDSAISPSNNSDENFVVPELDESNGALLYFPDGFPNGFLDGIAGLEKNKATIKASKVFCQAAKVEFEKGYNFTLEGGETICAQVKMADFGGTIGVVESKTKIVVESSANSHANALKTEYPYKKIIRAEPL